jgi:CRP-like cAMP-binding protein
MEEGEILMRQGDDARELMFIVDGPSPVTAITRERALLLVLPRDPFEQLFNGEDAVSRVFLDVILRDLVATLRQTLRPHARLAASV